jgi:thiosulfate dehydrogenase [quinone] large subunit
MPIVAVEENPPVMSRDAILGYTLLRVILGVNILSHGISRIITGPTAYAATLVTQFQSTPLANWLVSGFGSALPWIEALLGVLLLLGIKLRWTVLLGGALLAVLTYGVCLIQQWEVAALQLIYAVVYALLLILRQWNVISIDGWLARPHKSTV